MKFVVPQCKLLFLVFFLLAVAGCSTYSASDFVAFPEAGKTFDKRFQNNLTFTKLQIDFNKMPTPLLGDYESHIHEAMKEGFF